ncbi:acyl-coenzyme A synthetase ACSM1 [Prionailurus iriomotensis]
MLVVLLYTRVGNIPSLACLQGLVTLKRRGSWGKRYRDPWGCELDAEPISPLVWEVRKSQQTVQRGSSSHKNWDDFKYFLYPTDYLPWRTVIVFCPFLSEHLLLFLNHPILAKFSAPEVESSFVCTVLGTFLIRENRICQVPISTLLQDQAHLLPREYQAGVDLRILCQLPEPSSTMQRLMRLQVLWGIRKSYHGFHPAPWYLCCRSLSGAGTLRWNDYDRPKEFNFASDVLDYWTQMEQRK